MSDYARQIRMEHDPEQSMSVIWAYDSEGGDFSFFDMFSARDVQSAVDASSDAKTIVLRINTVGGNPYEAVAMYNVLRSSGKRIVAIADGVAASSGSLLLQAGDERRMRRGSVVMVHHPALRIQGDIRKLEKGISQLRATTEAVLDVYERRTGKSRQSLMKMMDDETWMTATEAKSEGFVDGPEDEPAIQMRVSPSRFEALKSEVNMSAAEPLLNVQHPEKPTSLPEKKELDMSGEKTKPADPETPQKPVITMTVEEYETMKAKGATAPVAEVTQPEMVAATAGTDPVLAERNRVTDITAACELAGCVSMEERREFITKGMSVSDVRGVLMQRMAAGNMQPKGTAGGQTADPNMKYREEYRDAISAGVTMQTTEDEYVNGRRVDDGLPRIQFGKEGA